MTVGKLCYLPLHGRAEPCRMLLNCAGVKFEDEIIAFDKLEGRKSEFPSGQVPVWIESDGKIYNQSIAILQGLALKHGYAPKGFLGVWANLWVSETIADFWSKGIIGKLFSGVTDEDIITYSKQHYDLNQMFENHLVKYNWKYMAGDNLTASDFHLYCFYTQLTLNKVVKHPKLSEALQQNLRDFPKLNEYLERMRLNLKDYMSNRPEYFF